MRSSEFESDYLHVKIQVETQVESVTRLFGLINEYPEGSAKRLEIEAEFLRNLSNYVAKLATHVRTSGKVTLYDDEY